MVNPKINNALYEWYLKEISHKKPVTRKTLRVNTCEFFEKYREWRLMFEKRDDVQISENECKNGAAETKSKDERYDDYVDESGDDMRNERKAFPEVSKSSYYRKKRKTKY